MLSVTRRLCRHLDRWATDQLERAGFERFRLSALEEYLSCPEKGLGMWLGSMTAYLAYVASCLFWAEQQGVNATYRLSARLTVHMEDPLGVAGTDGEASDTCLFWVVFAALMLSVALWLKLVWLDADPGMVATRGADFDEVRRRHLLPAVLAVRTVTSLRLSLSLCRLCTSPC